MTKILNCIVGGARQIFQFFRQSTCLFVCFLFCFVLFFLIKIDLFLTFCRGFYITYKIIKKSVKKIKFHMNHANAIQIDENLFFFSKHHTLIQQGTVIELMFQCLSSPTEVLQLLLCYLSIRIVPQQYRCSIYPCLCPFPLSIQHL